MLLRVADEGRLAPGWTAEAAADWTVAHVQPGTWDLLVGRYGWSARDYTERTVRRILAELVVAGDRHSLCTRLAPLRQDGPNT